MGDGDAGDERLKRSHESMSPQTPVEIRKKMRKNAKALREDSGSEDDAHLQRLAKKKKVEQHPGKATAESKPAAPDDSELDDDDIVPPIPLNVTNRRVSDKFHTPPKASTSRSVFETTTNAEENRRNSGLEANLPPPAARVLTEEEMERRRRRRNSKTFQSRRKSLTPNAKAKQYVSEMYSTIIKMSSENKINSKNSWSLHLIDHMEDILVDKQQDDEAPDSDTYNFQKASCTLDASVKIYSYRVDDTWNSSFKVLENLTRGDEVRHDDGDEEATEKRTTSKKLTVANTIETNLKNINMKSVDLEFQVDPLFQKMSQAFDEGGAKGMLMVNLSVHNGCKIVLDSSNVKASNQTDTATFEEEKPRKMINIAGLTKRLRSSTTAVESFDICPRLDHFYDQLKTMNNEYFDKKISVPRLDVTASSHNRRLTLLSQGLITPRKTPSKTPVKSEAGDTLGPSQSAEIEQPDFDMGGGDDGMDYDGDAPQTPAPKDEEETKDPLKEEVKPEPQEPSIAKPLKFEDEEEEQNTHLLESALLRSVNAEQMDEYSFFDAKSLKNWAGPQHWKVKLPGIRIKRAVRKEAAPKPAQEEENTTAPKKKRNTAGIKFNLTAAEVTQALKKPRHKKSLEISATVLKKNESMAAELVHPVDLHMKIERFYQLFTRPRSNVMFASMMRPRKDNFELSIPTAPISRNNDDQDDGIDFDGGGNDFLNDEDFQVSGLIQAERIVDKVDIQYEKFAKRVDVKKLKESIWETLPFHNAEPDPVDELAQATEKMGIKEEVSFEELVSEVAPKVPSNVTVSFYFICMLHLANDKGLELIGQDDMRDFKILHDPPAPST
ncbi:unnamed protein product [Aphanomyces euteiches]|uniref:Condensin complex subunit 2 n=1 Tax=Aphanomyces euteiches TaxID=100861 RepID=A0A6G0XUU4_9STRA|nr:hypothetical protein Ae201684_000920 [Aphanomyces euteiches]KAH9099654.1 hypothetical protein Ae201684P_018667 [Aphanomyces euteiches]KAH9141535.1 hypothetical protein AeRB84_014315 [Aphanomyces euteiches]